VNIQYWIDTTECVCASKRPIGGCLHCDLLSLKQQLADLRSVLDALRVLMRAMAEDAP
jgi:hypothetical protein